MRHLILPSKSSMAAPETDVSKTTGSSLVASEASHMESAGVFIFGLKLSTLTVMTDVSKHNSTLSSVGKSKGGQVSKIVEISSVGLYCNAIVASQEPPDIPSMADSQKYGRFRPIQISLSKRHNGWQRLWWQYAQNAILADVRGIVEKFVELFGKKEYEPKDKTLSGPQCSCFKFQNDIYEATEFNLVVAVSEDSLRTENLLSSSVKLNICQIVATITNK
ncbi:hypothetical protein HPP92_001377 [Vanilla planifolia]|uniref:Uncharacterized protein n=1 Tax=Vanilla planifolia TaxID=51239 RepID=A0A835RQY8_VANPL|nr:hypothetical protein HPP92_001377 [Vanilla planifolia]